MSWSDLERLVADAETSPALQQVLGYRLTRADLQNAWLEHHNAGEVQGATGVL